MDEAHGVDAIQRQHHLGGVEAGPLLGDIVVAHQVDQVSAWHVLHDHVEVAVVLECIEQLGGGGARDISLVRALTDAPHE